MIGFVVAGDRSGAVFFITLLIFGNDRSRRSSPTPPTNGQGLNPLLQNCWMVIHPPSPHPRGFVAATRSRSPSARWRQAASTMPLAQLGADLDPSNLLLPPVLRPRLGGRWAYEELGWGGYWAWDPVENAGFIRGSP
ncbi:MAG: hypothetical protein IPH80_28545 [Myxococcales bacterium]|nr:hypothetical protein [Myxococcales bacterium]